MIMRLILLLWTFLCGHCCLGSLLADKNETDNPTTARISDARHRVMREIGGYMPGTAVTDVVSVRESAVRNGCDVSHTLCVVQAQIDLDLKLIEDQLDSAVSSSQSTFDIALEVYSLGGHASPYALLHLVNPLNVPLLKHSLVSGRPTDTQGLVVVGRVADNVPSQSITAPIAYDIESSSSSLPACRVGGLTQIAQQDTSRCKQIGSLVESRR